ncbi:MAG: anthranilate phosphoribosyltransferase [Planctomycetes bacterium]|nr:anthranilate phosphoribosyltransferase [Planctomycetota bacterium]
MLIEQAYHRVAAGQDLAMEDMTELMDAVMQGQCDELLVGQLLTALHAKGETVEEVAGAATALRRHMTPIRSHHASLVDTCGTGGDGSGTFNISTAAALVTAAAGVPVAKHGNRGITSKSGSADVLAALGVNIEADNSTVERCLNEVGICFCFAPLLHPSMKHVAALRRKLGTPTIFNLLGPLCNPASARYQLLGVGREPLRRRLVDALRVLGTERSAVVRGADGLDEITLSGPTDVSIVRGHAVEHTTWRPQDFNVREASLESLTVDGPSQSAAIIVRVLAGEIGPARDIVVVNAAAALWVAGHATALDEAAGKAATAIDDGRAKTVLARLVQVSHQ